jgi:hypothetical protein
MIENPFDAPIPGQSLTDTPGNPSWEHPPQFTDVEQASEYVWGKIHNERALTQIILFLKEGVPVEAIARMVLFGGFMEGKWTPDVAILLSEIVFKQIMAIGIKTKIPNMKLFLKDQGTAKLHKKFAKFQISKQEGKENSQVKNKAKEFAKEIKAEIEAKESSGLMTKETK